MDQKNEVQEDQSSSINKSSIVKMKKQRKKKMKKKGKEEENNNLYIPEETVANILSRIPGKAILKFRAVCKEWCALSRSPHFIKLHHERARNATTPPRVLVLSVQCDDDGWYHKPETGIGWITLIDHPLMSLPYDVDDDHHHHHHLQGRTTSFEIDWPNRRDVPLLFMSNSCNGLVCIHDDEDKMVMLFNPTTREWLKLPKPMPMLSSRSPCFPRYHLGFHPITNRYKLVHVSFVGKLPYLRKVHVECEVLDVVAGSSWRRVSEKFDYLPHDHGVTSVRGVMYWGAMYMRAVETKLVSFDLGTEEIREVPFPESECIRKRSGPWHLVELEGDVCFAVVSRGGGGGTGLGDEMNIWVLEDESNHIWTHKYKFVMTVTLPPSMMRNLRPSTSSATEDEGEDEKKKCFWHCIPLLIRDGMILLESHRSLCYYDVQQQSEINMKKVVYRDRYLRKACVIVDNLIPLTSL